MEIKEENKQGYVTLTPVGEIDANSSVDLDEKMEELIGDGRLQIHVNMEETNYISSAGLGVFVSRLDELNVLKGKLVLSSLQENVKDVFELLGLTQLITIVEDDSEVATYFKQQ